MSPSRSLSKITLPLSQLSHSSQLTHSYQLSRSFSKLSHPSQLSHSYQLSRSFSKLSHPSSKLSHPSQLSRSFSKLSHPSSKLPRPLTVLVEGNIGSGKSHFLNRFTKFRQIEVLQEPVEKWRNVGGCNLLEKMYQDPHRWALPFQTYVQLTMLEQHTKANRPVKMMERSLYSARYCFVENMKNSGKLQPSEFQVLSEWFIYLTHRSNIDLSVDLIVYLQTSPQVAHTRLKSRNRGEEHLIPLEYVQDLHDLHEDWLITRKFPLPSKVLVINADKDIHELDQDFEAVKKFLSSSEPIPPTSNNSHQLRSHSSHL